MTWAIALFIVSLLPFMLRGQSGLPTAPGGAPSETGSGTPTKAGKALKQETNLVLVNATVTDPYGRIVAGLDQSNFRVYEDGVEQEVVHFANEDVPASIGVVLDNSGSMANKIDKSRLAATQFFKTSNPEDEFSLVNFSDRARLTSTFTSNIGDLQNKLMFMGAKGTTALLDAVYLGLSEMSDAHNSRHALLIISDGGDNHSRYSERDVRNLVRESDVQIYAIGIYEPFGLCPTPEECWGPELLDQLTGMTGGHSFRVTDPNQLPDIAEKISMELRSEYVIGFQPVKNVHDGKWHKIKVKLHPPRGLPPLSVYARSGYLAAAY